MTQFMLTFIIVTGILSSSLKGQELKTVEYVDLAKYAGKWYEIASYPQRFQKNCVGTTAEYVLDPKGFVRVTNKCYKDSFEGRLISIKGKAFVEKNSGNARLKVQFFWPFRGKYWIIDIDTDYNYAVVSHPNREYLWILSRSARMDEKTYQIICEKLIKMQFDLSRLKKTLQK
jgi:apolipoprotein D and lipocalin family protein